MAETPELDRSNLFFEVGVEYRDTGSPNKSEDQFLRWINIPGSGMKNMGGIRWLKTKSKKRGYLYPYVYGHHDHDFHDYGYDIGAGGFDGGGDGGLAAVGGDGAETDTVTSRILATQLPNIGKRLRRGAGSVPRGLRGGTVGRRSAGGFTAT